MVAHHNLKRHEHASKYAEFVPMFRNLNACIFVGKLLVTSLKPHCSVTEKSSRMCDTCTYCPSHNTQYQLQGVGITRCIMMRDTPPLVPLLCST